MIKEALEFLSQRFVLANNLKKVFESDEEVRFIDNGGNVHNVKKEPKPLVASANDLGSLVLMVTEDSTVWHNSGGVELVINTRDGSYRSDRVKWSLSSSDKFKRLKAGTGSIDHKGFVQYIVQNLRDELEQNNPGVLGSLRSLKFATNDTQDNDIQHGKESMGRSINRQVTGASDLPETVVLGVRRWAELDVFVNIEMILIIDAEKKTLELRPLADAATRADIEANATLGEMIRREAKCLVMHGSSN